MPDACQQEQPAQCSLQVQPGDLTRGCPVSMCQLRDTRSAVQALWTINISTGQVTPKRHPDGSVTA